MVLQGLKTLEEVFTFIEELKRNFNEREIVILASTAAQVNYWDRLIQALGILPLAFQTSVNSSGPAMIDNPPTTPPNRLPWPLPHLQ